MRGIKSGKQTEHAELQLYCWRETHGETEMD
jgi:hypothetical protein